MSLSFDNFKGVETKTQSRPEPRTWEKRGGDIASLKIASSENSHPSFADIFWKDEKRRIEESIAALRLRMDAGLTEDDAAQLRAAEIFVEHIETETKKYQDRDSAIDEAIVEFRKLFSSFSVEDRAACTELIYLLRQFLKEKHRSLQDIGSILQKRINFWPLKTESREAIEASVHGFFGEKEDEEDVETNVTQHPIMRVSHLPASVSLADSSHSVLEIGDSLTRLENNVSSDTEEESGLSESAMGMDRARIEAIFTLAKIAAESFVERPGLDIKESLEAAKAAIENEKDSMSQRIEESLIGAELADTFFESYLFAFQKAGNEASAFNNSVRTIIGLRCRILVLEKAIAKAPKREENRVRSPWEILGVLEGSSSEEIETAYAKRLGGLDAESDREEIADLHQVRRGLMRGIQLKEGNGHKNIEELAPIAPAVSETGTQDEKREGIFSRMLRSPGKWARAVVGSLALLIAGGAPVGEYGHAELEEVSAMNRVELPESNFAEAGPVQQEVARDIRPLEVGDSVWKVVVSMLRERGLSTSNTNVQYFTHQALVDNGLDALSAMRLKAGTPLDVTGIRNEMDQRAGRVASADAAQTIPEKRSGEETAAPSIKSSTEEIYVPDLVTGRPYTELPTVANPEHVMQKGEHICKMVHNMLRSRGLNWTTERINFLTQVVVDQNTDRFRALVTEGKMKKMDETQVPFGAKLDFSNAIKILDDMELARKDGKKTKTVRQLAQEKRYKYPIMMNFPKK